MSDSEMSPSEFEELLLACQEIAALFPDGVVFIGGIAVYFHSINFEATRNLVEFTHDADFYISLADMADLRDIEDVVSNRRLNKHQLIKRGFDFDIYTERHSSLIVPYDQVIAHSICYDAIRVATLEHLFVLKLEAYRDRCASSKGQKDAKDLIRLALIAAAQKKPFKPDLLIAYLSDDHLKLIERIQRGAEFLSMAKGNAKHAKTMRDQFTKSVKRVTVTEP